MFSSSAETWSAGGIVLGPIFTGGRISGGVRAAEAQMTYEAVRRFVDRLPEEQRTILLLVTVANAIALGLVYFGWNKALQTGLLFITPINAGTYILAVSVSLFTAFLAVASQTLKAAWANPANSLRYE